jgi:large subunit ribosomal protein L24e
VSETQLYRRMHKKGADGEKAKAKKSRKVNTKGRGVFGASIDEIKKKRDQSAAARATARAKALRDAKAKKSADAKKSKSTARHNQGGAKQTYARPSSKGAKGKAVTGRGK